MKLFLFSVVPLSHAADCTFAVNAANTVATQIVGATASGGIALAPPGVSVVIGFLDAFNVNPISFLTTNNVLDSEMTCQTDFMQTVRQSFRTNKYLDLSNRMKGYNSVLQAFASAYSAFGFVFACTNYLVPLNVEMITDLPAFYTDDPDNQGYAITILPLLADFVNLRTMVLADLYDYYLQEGYPSASATNLISSIINNENNYASTYLTTKFTDDQFNNRISQISCSAGSPYCDSGTCSSNSCGCWGGCADGAYCWKAVFNVPDTWRPNWYAPGYPHEEDCFFQPNYCPGNPPALCMGAPSGWATANTNCQNAATTEQYNVMNRLQTARINFQTAIAGSNSLLTKIGGCFSGDNLIKLDNGNLVALKDLSIGQKVQIYNIKTGKLTFSPIVFFAINSQFDSSVQCLFIRICAGLPTNCVDLTPNHAVKLNNGTYLKAIDIHPGDIIYGGFVVNSSSSIQTPGCSFVVPVTQDGYLLTFNGVPFPIFGFGRNLDPSKQEKQFLMMEMLSLYCKADKLACSDLFNSSYGQSYLAQEYLDQSFQGTNFSFTSLMDGAKKRISHQNVTKQQEMDKLLNFFYNLHRNVSNTTAMLNEQAQQAYISMVAAETATTTLKQSGDKHVQTIIGATSGVGVALLLVVVVAAIVWKRKRLNDPKMEDNKYVDFKEDEEDNKK